MDLFSPELDGVGMGEGTYTVAQLGGEIQQLLREGYPSVWVVGEVQRLVARPNGHRYFELVEKGEGDSVVGKLDAVIWKGDFARIAPVLVQAGQALTEGVAVRCRVQIDFYPPHGRLQLHVKQIDPVFMLGELARRRQETWTELERAGLIEANRARTLPELPLAVALISSHGSAASHDFLATLRESGLGFRVTFLHSAVQGSAAESEVASALAAAQAMAVDCIALVRGGGSKSDLAAFDSRAIAFAVARCRLPVLTGLGHEIDQSVTDRVAHQAFKTPTKVAEFLVARIEAAELAMTRLGERARGIAELALARARERLGALERRALFARGRIAAAETRRTALAWRLAGAARARLATERARLDGRARLVAELAPTRALARGYSITRDATGALVRDRSSVRAGETISTTVANGTIVSRVEER
jgi:exodeoxyribonuclease VII large subunit